jgi:lysophospholipase L1-like esterase
LEIVIMKSILCYGDSLTWGFEAGTMKRHAFEDRWPNVLAAGLEGKARTIAEGLNGRTTIYDDFAVQEDRNGARTLPVMLSTHQPLDLVIIMLGSNDLKFGGRCRAIDAKWGMERLVEIVKQFPYGPGSSLPEILIMAPPQLCSTKDEDFDLAFGHAIEESKNFARHYAKLASETGCHFFDAARVAKADPTDGVHLDARNTRAIGEALVGPVRKILKL